MFNYILAKSKSVNDVEGLSHLLQVIRDSDNLLAYQQWLQGEAEVIEYYWQEGDEALLANIALDLVSM